MLARTAPHLTFSETVPSAALADRLPPSASASVSSRAATTGQDAPAALAGRGAVLPGLRSRETEAGPCPPRTSTDIVCANNDGCICPLSGHVTDVERAVMNDIARQASRLATVLALIFAVVAVAAMIMLVVR